jgi:hypothetical protein
MPPEAPVLESHEHLQIARIGIGDIEGKPPTIVGRRESPQQTPVPIQHRDRHRLRTRHRRLAQRIPGKPEYSQASEQ